MAHALVLVIVWKKETHPDGTGWVKLSGGYVVMSRALERSRPSQVDVR